MATRTIEFSLNEYYHIYNRGVERRVIFLDEADHERFVRLLYSANSDTSIYLSNFQGVKISKILRGKPLVAIGAWCLMPNHFHILLKEVSENGISIFMQKLLSGYSTYFNKKHYRRGTLFESKFKAKHLNTDEYLKYQYTYIHLNPIGIIDKGWKKKEIADKDRARKFLKEYKYSSYKDYLGEEREESIILNIEEFPEYFSRRTDFEKMIEYWINFDEEGDGIEKELTRALLSENKSVV
jgi:putative transposase